MFLFDMICSVSPIYYVIFTTAVLTASFVLFQGFNMTSGIGTMSLLCGFLIIFSGVYLLNYHEDDGSSHERLAGEDIAHRDGDNGGRFSLQELPRFSGETQCEDRTRLMQS